MKTILSLILVLTFFFVSCESPNEPKIENKWVSISNTALSNTTVREIAVSKHSIQNVYLGTHKGVFKSASAGESWSLYTNGLTNKDIRALVIDKNDPTKVYAGSWGKGVFLSQDAGVNWTAIGDASQPPLVTGLVATSNGSATTIWSATENGVYKSADKKTWQKNYSNGRVLSIASSPHDENTLFVGIRYKGNFRTIDSGENWQAVNSGVHSTSDGIAAANSFAFNYANAENIIFSTGWIDLYRSFDKGEQWEQFAETVENLDVAAVATDRHKSNMIWVATENHGVYKSSDSGKTWEKFNDGLDSFNMTKICVASNASKSIVYAATEGNGIYKYVME
jgi:photosystem II stability/assembly factor-like uncharacterized protein